jgi:hypothetical protein
LSGASNAKGGQVRLCVNDAPDPNASAITIDKDGHFSSGTTSILKVIAGSKVVAEVVPAGQYGAISNEVIVGACTSTGSGNLAQPTPALNPLVANVSIVSGKLMGAVAGMVRVCVDNRQVAEPPIASNGTFTAALQEPLGGSHPWIAFVMA